MIERIAEIFETYAPLSEADLPWDNVGILIKGKNNCKKMMLTVDLTMDVVDECLRKQVQNIISYHPVIFTPLKRISDDECVVSECVKYNISVYCPHTALDRRMNEHLLKVLACVGTESTPSVKPTGISKYIAAGTNTESIESIVEKLKHLAELHHVRVSLGKHHTINSAPAHVQVGVGAAFKQVACSDTVLVTGEMSHHNLLYNASKNVTVILLEHSNSERIFFRHSKTVFDRLFEGFEVLLSETDKDPILIV